MVCLWSLRSYTFIRNLTGANQKTLCLLSSCDFSPDGAVLATAAFSGSSWWIDLWDPYTAEKLATLAYVYILMKLFHCVATVRLMQGNNVYLLLFPAATTLRITGKTRSQRSSSPPMVCTSPS